MALPLARPTLRHCVYPSWVVEASPPPPPDCRPPDGPRRGSWHDIHALYLSQVGVSEREEMIKAPIIIQGAKHPRIEEGEVEKLNNLQWLKWFINTGEVLLKIYHPVPKIHTTHLFLSSLPALSYNSYRAWGLPYEKIFFSHWQSQWDCSKIKISMRSRARTSLRPHWESRPHQEPHQKSRSWARPHWDSHWDSQWEQKSSVCFLYYRQLKSECRRSESDSVSDVIS